jgi:Fe-S cluster assembly protein SufD
MSASPALQSFDRIWEARSARAAQNLSPMQAFRREAMAQFDRLGIPTLRDESWHYSNLRVLAQRAFGEPAAAAVPAVDAGANLSWLISGEDCAMLTLFNGIPVPGPAGRLPAGITVTTLRDMEAADPHALSCLMLPLSEAEHERWVLLNSALFEDGLHVRISARCATPLLILHVAAPEGAQEVVNPRIIIDAAPGASALIIEHHVSGNANGVFSNSVCSIELRENAALEHFRVFSGNAAATHMDHLHVRASQNAHLRQHTICLDGAFVRANLDANLAAPDAALEAFSLLTGHDARHTDCVNIVTHAAPHTQSRQTARAIASGRSRAVFNSKVIVNAGAQKADSHQSCRGLLLSPTAEIDTRPQLEINANDVKCGHGATTGRLDPDMLFYLLARGLDRGTAQSLLVFAFLADVLTGMSLPAVRNGIESKLIEQLPNSQLLRQFR